MLTSSRLAYALVNSLLRPSRRLPYPRPSKFTNRKRTWPTNPGSLVLQKCFQLDKISSSLTRSFTYLQNQRRFISYAQSCVWAVHVASKSSVSRLWKHNHCWIKPTPHSTLSYEKRTLSPYTSSAWQASSCSAIQITLSSLTGMVGVLDQIGELLGKAHHKLSRYSIRTFWHLSQVLSRFDIWRVGVLFTSLQQRILDGFTHLPERYVRHYRVSYNIH